MKLRNLVGERFKERPTESVIDSHALMLRGGYIKNLANGIYSSYTPLKRITRKIEQIIREEMDQIGGQEVLFSVVLPASLWEESGRYERVGSELLRFSDRNGSKYLLGMTHEEAAVHLVRDYGQSYLKYPFMIYQIQTKFRDEARPRGGLIRVREFTMKDAYSFHTSQENLTAYYDRCHKAYERIFSRVGLPQVVSVASDSGMMGGSLSHEFMLLTPIGEDTVVTCSCCDYKANMEMAENILCNIKDHTSQPLTLVHTPAVHTIEEVCDFLKTTPEKSCKAVVYQREVDDEYVVLFIRGDFEVNEAKLKTIIHSDVRPAVIDKSCGLIGGFIGAYKLRANCTVIFDKSLENTNNLICGGNLQGYHYTGLDITRDVGDVVFVDVAKVKQSGTCPICRQSALTLCRGIEVGNIFQLGTQYTQAMDMTYVDEKGNREHPLMGCYGIGVGRLAAAICEAQHDNYGPAWPVSIAPWQVHLCAVRVDDERVKTLADQIYIELHQLNLEVIYDDRAVSAGVMFADADLLGVPFRVIVSPKNIKEDCVEIVKRDKTITMKAHLSQYKDVLLELIDNDHI